MGHIASAFLHSLALLGHQSDEIQQQRLTNCLSEQEWGKKNRKRRGYLQEGRHLFFDLWKKTEGG